METSLNEPDWRFASKWHPEIAELGYTMVPNALLFYYDLLDITPTEFLILVNIESFRWDAKKLPYPTVETLAKRTGMKSRTVTRNITTLEKNKRLIERVKRKRTSNQYSFDRLLYRLLEIVRYDNDGSIAGIKRSSVHVIKGNPYPSQMSSKEDTVNKNEIKKTNKRTPSESFWDDPFVAAILDKQ
jgi:DNA-binding MarR family transcriptional regulator